MKTVSSSESEPGVVCAVNKQFIGLKCPHGAGLPLLSWSGWTGDMVNMLKNYTDTAKDSKHGLKM